MYIPVPKGILRDTGADCGGEGKSKWAEKMAGRRVKNEDVPGDGGVCTQANQ